MGACSVVYHALELHPRLGDAGSVEAVDLYADECPAWECRVGRRDDLVVQHATVSAAAGWNGVLVHNDDVLEVHVPEGLERGVHAVPSVWSMQDEIWVDIDREFSKIASHPDRVKVAGEGVALRDARAVERALARLRLVIGIGCEGRGRGWEHNS